MFGKRTERFWLNYGICPRCGHRHEPRVGPITCEDCRKTFDNKGLQLRPSSAPGGWPMTVAGGAVVAAILLGVSYLQ